MGIEEPHNDLIGRAGFWQVDVVEKRVSHALPDVKLGLDSPGDEH